MAFLNTLFVNSMGYYGHLKIFKYFQYTITMTMKLGTDTAWLKVSILV